MTEELKAKVEQFLLENEGGTSVVWGDDVCTTYDEEGQAIDDYMIDVEDNGDVCYTPVSCPSVTGLIEITMAKEKESNVEEMRSQMTIEKKSWDDLINKILPYLDVENTTMMNADAVAGAIKDMITAYGYECLDSGDDEHDWIENHPEIHEEDCEWSHVSDLEFLCSNEPYDYGGRDVDWYEFNISFYGIWGSIGVFQVGH